MTKARQTSVVSGFPRGRPSRHRRDDDRSPWPAAYGSAAFLRAWARRPGFRLRK
ncbi:DUF6368 family protein [Streptomyces sp. NPDC014846]|uniref:DUF6368 family protein n=1 Tax=Streptomyces sp. NPDC014846 TaxID=3364922 RepID=UPI0036F85B31